MGFKSFIRLTLYHDYEINPQIHWALDMNYSDDLNVLDVTKLVYFILFH